MRDKLLMEALQSGAVSLLREADEVLGSTGSLAVDEAISLISQAQALLQHYQGLVPDGPLAPAEPTHRKVAARGR